MSSLFCAVCQFCNSAHFLCDIFTISPFPFHHLNGICAIVCYSAEQGCREIQNDLEVFVSIMEQEYSYLFVVCMGMGVTFIGLTAIIFLTLLMGKILTAHEAKNPQPAPQATAPIPQVTAPQVPSDGVEDSVKVAILAALAQDPGFHLDRVAKIDIRRV